MPYFTQLCSVQLINRTMMIMVVVTVVVVL